MINTLQIKNFKSLKNVKFDLQKINLFIGPNNSGKTNVLKAFEFLRNVLLFGKEKKVNHDNFHRYFYNFADEKKPIFENPITLTFVKKNGAFYEYYFFEFWGIIKDVEGNEKVLRRECFLQTKEKLPDNFDLTNWKNHLKYIIKTDIIIEKEGFNKSSMMPKYPGFVLIKYREGKIVETITEPMLKPLVYQSSIELSITNDLINLLDNFKIYQPDVLAIKEAKPLDTDNYIKADASNLVSFLDNMRDSYPKIYNNITKDLFKCISDFTELRFKKIKLNGVVSKQLGLLDKNGRIFWVDELSEGTLYFLALLAIVNQPEPPEFLFIEEPETGIHPRRLHEIIQFVFRLADDNDIQIFITTHSPQIVNEFEDIPESVFVFDNISGYTQIKNLMSDIIKVSDKKSEKDKLPKINYTETLGEHWVYGFIGGVPL